jgi:ABC-type multidrug transport system ATPase subunit
VEFRDVHKQYGETWALRGISFEVYPGECFGIVSPPGAGKSTILRLLGNLARVTQGEILVEGTPLADVSRHRRARLGYVPQHSTLDDALTVAENLQLHAVLYQFPPHEVGNRIAEVLALAGLAEHRGAFLTALTQGMRRRLEIARALFHRPGFLLLDEPTAGLDPPAQEGILRLVRELRETGDTTIILSTSRVEEAEALCDRIAILHQGRLLVTADSETLKESIHRDVVQLQVAPSRQGEIEKFLDLGEVARGVEILHWKGVDGGFRIECTDGRHLVLLLLDYCRTRSIDIGRIGFSGSSLEDVFIFYTRGQDLRLTNSGGTAQ